MWFVTFMRSGPGRITRAMFGVWLILHGALSASLTGVALMMVGVVPAVTGIAGICLIDEFMKANRRAHQA